MAQEIRFDLATKDMLLDVTRMESAVVDYRVVEEVAARALACSSHAAWSKRTEERHG